MLRKSLRGGCDRGRPAICGPRARLGPDRLSTSLFQLVVCGSTGGMNLRVRSSRVPCPCVCIVSERRDEVCGVRFIIARQAMVWLYLGDPGDGEGLGGKGGFTGG